MENQTNYSNSNLKNSLLFAKKQDNIKLLKKDLKSKSENKHKKFHKNYNSNSENIFQNTKNNLKKLQTLEEFKQKLKIDELSKKLNNMLKKKQADESQSSVLDLSALNNLNGKSEKDAFGSFYKQRDIKTANATSHIRLKDNNAINNNINFSNFNTSLIGNNLNITARTNFFSNAHSSIANANNNINNLSKFNSSLKSDFPEFIPRNIRTANMQVGGNPRKTKFQSVDFNMPNFLNPKSNNKDFIYNSNSKNNNNNSDSVNKLNLINNLNLNSNINNNTHKESNKYEKQVENTAITFDDNKTNFNETRNNFTKNLNIFYSINNNNDNNKNKNSEAFAKLEKEMNELVKCYFSCKDQDLEDQNINSFTYKELLSKLQLKNFSNPEEEKFILEYLKKHKNVSDTSELYNSTFKKFSQIQKVYISESSYKNPVLALRQLKLNKDIFNNVTDFRQQKQIETYLDKFNEEQDKVLKQMQMRRVKETDIKALNSHEDIGEVINPADLLHEKHDASSYNKQLSRDQVLNYNLEFFAGNNTEFKMKPWARSSFTLSMDGNQMIMFGGISGEILYQVWVCDCKSKFFIF